MITQYDETGNAMLTNTSVNKPVGVTTVQSLASQYQNALAEQARRAAAEKTKRTPFGYGAPGYWWRGMTPYVAPGGVAAPVMTVGNGAGIPSVYSGVTGAEAPVVEVTAPAPTTGEVAIAPEVSAPVEPNPSTGKAGLYSIAPTWAKEYEARNQKEKDTPGDNWGNLPAGFVQANGGAPANAAFDASAFQNWGVFPGMESGPFSWPNYTNGSELLSGGPYGPWSTPKPKTNYHRTGYPKPPTSNYHRTGYPTSNPTTVSDSSASNSSGSGYAGGSLWGGGGGYGGGGGGYNPYNGWNWNLINWNVR